jgi:hypothetical protein
MRVDPFIVSALRPINVLERGASDGSRAFDDDRTTDTDDVTASSHTTGGSPMCWSPRARRAAQVVLAVVVAVTTFLVAAAPAFADMNTDPKARSYTNPFDRSDPGSWWREGWGNSLYPDLTFTTPPSDTETQTPPLETIDHPILGFVYRVERDPPAAIDTTVPDPTAAPNQWANLPTGTSLTQHIFDLRAIRDSIDPAMSLEGTWNVRLVFRSARPLFADAQWPYAISYDGTPPLPVTTFYADVSRNVWSDLSRRRLTWSGASDALSGVGAYDITLTNKLMGTRETRVTLPGANTATIEDLGPGLNTISIRTVDRATNRSVAVSMNALVDTDTPTVTFVAPKGTTVGRWTTFSVLASDLAGIARVKFWIDGHPVMTRTKAPYTFGFDTGSLGSGNHTIVAEATDMFGHRRTTSKSFKVDLTLPRISVSSVAPNPFYPRLVDGYKDYSITSFYLAKPAYVRFSVYRSNGTWAWGYQKSLGAGYRSIAWNGRNSSGTVMPEGTYYYRISATDAVGNTYTTGRYSSTIRYYIIVRLAANKAKVVAH